MQNFLFLEEIDHNFLDHSFSTSLLISPTSYFICSSLCDFLTGLEVVVLLLSLFSNRYILRVMLSSRLTDGKMFDFLMFSEEQFSWFAFFAVGDEQQRGDKFSKCFWVGPFTVFRFLYGSSRISLSILSLGSSRGILFC